MDYYAFGGTLSSYVNGSTVDKYKFTGKERDSETGLDYFGARYYDSKICRWMSVDPLADLNPGISPYAYCHNDPINRIDPDGMDDEPNVLPTVFVTAKRQPQDLKQMTWFQMSIGLANNLVYMNRANQYEVYYGVPYLKISPNQKSNVLQGIVPTGIDGPASFPKSMSPGLKALFEGGSVRGQAIMNIKNLLLREGFEMIRADKGIGYLFKNEAGEQVRLMRRNGGWDIRIRLGGGNHVNEFGIDPGSRGGTHDIEIFSK
ncbi:MAG TPA: RHS repeat-associated core domain-containing protein [Ignavibacteriales bacterium]|nr:RHS repeat-associated core domain-containing protein [Ignavibacteriales bacterium]